MKDKGIAHIGIGSGKGDDKASDAVKMAVESPLLETTISGATHVIINVSRNYPVLIPVPRPLAACSAGKWVLCIRI